MYYNTSKLEAKVMEGKIRKMRNQLPITTTQLAYRMGIQQSTVVRMEQSEERGSISLETLKRAAEALGCQLFYELRPTHDVFEETKGRQRQVAADNSKGHAANTVAETLNSDDISTAQRLTPTQRLQRSMQMSDFIRSLKTSSYNV